MTQNQETLSFIATLVGKPIIVIYNDFEGQTYTYLIEELKMANPGNYIFDNSLTGKEITKVIAGMVSFSATSSHLTGEFAAIQSQVEAIKPVKISFPTTFKWVKINF